MARIASKSSTNFGENFVINSSQMAKITFNWTFSHSCHTLEVSDHSCAQNTVKRENSNFYVTAVRENQKFIYGGAVIFNDFSAKKIARIVDGKVDFVLVDTEKKVISNKKKLAVNLERSVKESIKKTKIFTYKGNDLAVEDAGTLINN